MKIFFTALSLLALISCDAPQRTRLQSAYDSLGNPYTGTNPNPESSGGNTGSLTGSAGSGSDSSAGSEYAGCDYSYKYHTMDIGHFAVCQSTKDETKFKFKTQLTHRNVKICLIPTFRKEDGSSTWIGQPQCLFTEAGKDYEGRLYKTRAGFLNEKVMGVVVLKYGLHTAYFNCMNAAINYVSPACPMGAATNANCVVAANQYMAQVCESFKRTYANSYEDISTR